MSPAHAAVGEFRPPPGIAAPRGTIPPPLSSKLIASRRNNPALRSSAMNGIIYLVGLIVIIMFILSFLGLR
jgi:hypothetical protein